MLIMLFISDVMLESLIVSLFRLSKNSEVRLVNR